MRRNSERTTSNTDRSRSSHSTGSGSGRGSGSSSIRRSSSRRTSAAHSRGFPVLIATSPRKPLAKTQGSSSQPPPPDIGSSPISYLHGAMFLKTSDSPYSTRPIFNERILVSPPPKCAPCFFRLQSYDSYGVFLVMGVGQPLNPKPEIPLLVMEEQPGLVSVGLGLGLHCSCLVTPNSVSYLLCRS